MLEGERDLIASLLAHSFTEPHVHDDRDKNCEREGYESRKNVLNGAASPHWQPAAVDSAIEFIRPLVKLFEWADSPSDSLALLAPHGRVCFVTDKSQIAAPTRNAQRSFRARGFAPTSIGIGAIVRLVVCGGGEESDGEKDHQSAK
jgi:hypothetical protein